MLVEHPIPKLFPFVVIITSTLMGRLSTRFWRVALGICAHSNTRTLILAKRPGVQLVFQFIPKFLVGLRTGFCASHSISSAQPRQTMTSWSSLSAQEHCYAGTDLGPLWPVKGNHNATTYKDILHKTVCSQGYGTVWGKGHI